MKTPAPPVQRLAAQTNAAGTEGGLLPPLPISFINSKVFELLMLNQEEYIELRKILNELIEKSKNGAVIIVEGIKDKKSLRDLGVEGKIIIFSSYVSVVDKVKNEDVIILTDYDERGNKIEKGLISKFLSWGVIPDTNIKKRIFALIKKDVTAVENLAEYVSKIENNLKLNLQSYKGIKKSF